MDLRHDIPLRDLFSAAVVLESAYEPDDLRWANAKLVEWNLTQEQLFAIFNERMKPPLLQIMEAPVDVA